MFELVLKSELVGNYGESLFDFRNMETICKEFRTDAYSISIWKMEHGNIYHIFIDHYKRGFYEINVYSSTFAIQQKWDSGEVQDIKKCPVWIKKIIENNCY